MTAPLIGYGIRRHERGSFTAFSSRVDTLTVNETHGVNHTYSYTFGVDDSVSAVPILSCDGFGYLQYQTPEQQPEAPPLFQPEGMTYFNWLLQPGIYYDGSRRTYCPALDAPPDTRDVVNTNGEEARRFGRFGIRSLTFDRSGDIAGSMHAPSGGSPRARQARARLMSGCPADPLSLMRTEIAPLGCAAADIALEACGPQMQFEPDLLEACRSLDVGGLIALPTGEEMARDRRKACQEWMPLELSCPFGGDDLVWRHYEQINSNFFVHHDRELAL